jgi:hypothetical protein
MKNWSFKAKFYLFLIYVSQSVYCRLIGLYRMWKKWSLPNLRYIYSICLVGLSKATRNLSQIVGVATGGSNRKFPEYKSEEARLNHSALHHRYLSLSGAINVTKNIASCGTSCVGYMNY